MAQAYKDASPEGAEVLYGLVAEETHRNGRPHYHMPLMASKRHKWLPIAHHLRVKCGINVDVSVWHPSYISQYTYVRRPTSKKPMSHIDPNPYVSPMHPQGETLTKMLRKAEQTANACLARTKRPLIAAAEGDVGAPKKRPRALQFCEVAQVVKRYGVRTEAHMWELARTWSETQRDDRLADWANRQRSILVSLRKIQDFLTAKGANEGCSPGEILTKARFPLTLFKVPWSVRSWMRGGENGFEQKALVLAGKSKAGKTELLRTVCVEMGWPYIFASSVDELRDMRVPSKTALVVDDFDCHDQPPNWVKHLFDLQHPRTIKTRFTNVQIASGCPRLVSTNAKSLAEFLPPARNDEDWEGMARRVRFVLVKEPLKRTSPLPQTESTVTCGRTCQPKCEPITKTSEGSSDGFRVDRAAEIEKMTLQGIMEWKEKGLLSEKEFLRLKEAWFKSAGV